MVSGTRICGRRFGGGVELDTRRPSSCSWPDALLDGHYGANGMPMSEFKVASFDASDRGRERNIRLITWGAVLVMSGITLFAVYDARSASPQLVRALGWLAVVIVAAAIVGAHFLAARLGLEKFEHDLVFVLTDKEVVRRRRGWPDVQIGLAEIKTLYRRPGWLVVESNEPRRTMAIPERVEGFESLRSELTKHSPITAAPQRSPWGFIALVGSFLCWGLVLLSKDTGVVMGAGAVALLLLVWESSRLFRQLRRSPKRPALSLLIGLSWVAAALLVYLRIVRTS